MPQQQQHYLYVPEIFCSMERKLYSLKAWVLCPQGDRIFEWGGGESKIASPQEINLKTDVVSSESEIKGSTYVVTQEWVSRLRDACNCFGRKVHITRQRARKEGVKLP